MADFLSQLFTKIVAGEIPSFKLYEDELTYAFLDINPLSPGHALVIPKKRYVKMDQVPAPTAAAIGATIAKVAKAIMKATGCTDYNVLNNNGKPAHQEVPHVHFHIIPKTDSNGLALKWNPAPKKEADQAMRDNIAMREKIVAALESDADEHRLTREVVPRNYDLTLSPNLSTFTFDGKVVIEVDVLEPTSTVTMHAREIDGVSARVWKCGQTKDSSVAATGVNHDNEKYRMTLTFPEPLTKGSHSIEIDFRGTLNDKMAGFYRSTYKGSDGSDKVMATTQFEACDARRAFPCWDEPAFKATFDVTMIVADPSLTALSNMPVRSKATLEDGKTSYKYWRSPVMSTYLLAFIVGELESISTTTASGTDLSVYTIPGKLSQATFALDTGKKVIEFFEDYMGIAYPLPKQDMVAIPDFASGAMENWGLITYRETALLATDDSSASAKQRVAYVVAHELAHQWFGNLVTMEWWSDLWLNEGFATWAGWLAIDRIFPEWDVWTSFTNDDVGYAMKTDSLASSHPIQVTIANPDEIDQVFDALSYSKGASMIRMVEALVGADVFRLSLRNYLEKHQYKNTLTKDLWAAISGCAGFDVASIMDSWCLHTGFPVINVDSRDANNVLTLSQCRFLSGGDGSAEAHLWSIPLHGSNGSGTITSKTLTGKSCEFPGNGDYLKLNAGQTSFIRVNYDQQGWKALEAPITSLALPAVDRLGLISDAFALAKAGMMDTTVVLDLCQAYKSNEECKPVWDAVSSGLGEVSEICSSCDFFPKYEAFCGEVFADLFAKLGWFGPDDEPDLRKQLRSMCLGASAKYGNKGVIDESLKKFDAYVEGGELDSDLRKVVFTCAVKFGGKSQFDKMLALYESLADKDPHLQMIALQACGMTREKELIEKYLEFGFSGKVRPNNLLYVFATLAGNSAARDIAWDFVKANWKSKIIPMFEGSHALLGYMVALPIRGFVTFEKADDAEAFFAKNPVPSATMKLKQTLESIRTKAAWLDREKEKLATYFE